MPEKKTKRKCKNCQKIKLKTVKVVETKSERFGEENFGEYHYKSEEEEGEDEYIEEEEKFPCIEEEASSEEIVTTGHVLDEILPDKRKKRTPYFCPNAPRSRYEGSLPVAVTNDHQREAAIQKTVIDHLASLKITSEPFCKRQTAIIATIGPSCVEVSDIEDLLDSGMNIARFNMAYGDRCCQLTAIHNFKTALKNYHGRLGFKVPVGLLMDLKGPEIRTGKICRLYACDPENPQILIEKDSKVKITTETTFIDKITPNLIYVDFLQFPEYVRPGMKVYIDDGNIQLIVQQVKETEVIAKVEEEGYLRNYRPVHIPLAALNSFELTDADAEDIELAIEEEFDFIAVSKFHNTAVLKSVRGRLMECVLTARKLMEKSIMILSKISTFQAVEDIEEIVKYSDGVIIQRGDLGLDLPPEKVFVAQRRIIGLCNLKNKPVICSTELMKSINKRLIPDRSNIMDVALCVDDGADALCLTKETAIGLHPAEAIETTHHILREAEAAESKKYHFKELSEKLVPPIEPIVAIGMAACIIAQKIGASAIVVLTTSGKSAQIISWFRPRCIVLAVTKFERTANQLHLWRCICPVLYTGPCLKNNWFDNLDFRFQFGISFGKEIGFIRPGDPIVLVSGYGKSTAFTNCIRIVYASTLPDVFLEHPKEFYDNIHIQKHCKRGKHPCDINIK